MPQPSARPPSRVSTLAPALLTFGGLAAAFGVAACCGLPFILAELGLGMAGLGGLALLAAPHRQLLLFLAALLLGAGAVALWRPNQAAEACRVEGVCARPGVRLLTLVGLLVGSALLMVGYIYA